MSEVAEILKTAYEVFHASEDVPVVVDERKLGMAYAIPDGTETTVVDSFGPWRTGEVKQVFFQKSSLLGEVLAELQMILTWRFSDQKQYIIEAFLEKNVISLDPTVSLSLSVRFGQPDRFDRELDAYEIPFTVEVDYRPVGSNSTQRYKGVIRADGTGSFDFA